MTFDVAADAYLRFMGRYSERLAQPFAALADLAPGERVLDVGCGPGALTARLVELVGAGAVSAVDPSASFVEAVRERLPGVDVHTGTAERLPFPDGTFGAALAQLVVHFMTDAVAGLREMARVTTPGGTVATCLWDQEGDRWPLAVFSRAVRELGPPAPGEGRPAGAGAGAAVRAGVGADRLADLFRATGLAAPEESTVTVEASFAGFDDWWEPFTLGVGPAGDHVRGLDEVARTRLRDRCAALLPTGSFTLTASAVCVRARVPAPPG
jgi:SAM-dependent methyltransferase